MYQIVAQVTDGERRCGYAVVEAEQQKLSFLSCEKAVQETVAGNISNVRYDDGEIVRLDGVGMDGLIKYNVSEFVRPSMSAAGSYRLTVLSEEAMRAAVVGISQRRNLAAELDDYCNGTHPRKIFALYGLRRTGKTVLMCQKALELLAQGKRVLYLNVESSDNDRYADLYADVETAHKNGVDFLFIDEVTYIDRFSEWADGIYNMSAFVGMRVIVGGTDSYGIRLAANRSLFDRVYLCHTTYMSYKEARNLLHIQTLSEYIRTGGVLNIGWDRFHWREYMMTSIIDNIAHTVNGLGDARVSSLYLCSDEELRYLILDVLLSTVSLGVPTRTREYRHNDLSSAVELVVKSGVVVDNLLLEGVKQEFISKVFPRMAANEGFIRHNTASIKAELLYALVSVDAVTEFSWSMYTYSLAGEVDYVNERGYALSQPGLRYEIALEYCSCLLGLIAGLDGREVSWVKQLSDKIKSDIEGRITESIVISYCRKNLPVSRYAVSQINIQGGEVDMAIYDTETDKLDIYEIKRSQEIVGAQYRHLVDEKFCEALRRRFSHSAAICKRFVLYSGEDTEVKLDDGTIILYRNVEKFLCDDIQS